MDLRIVRHSYPSTLLDWQTSYTSVSSPIILMWDGFFMIANRTYEGHFFCITPDGVAWEETGVRGDFENSDSNAMRFRTLVSRVAQNYGKVLPNPTATFDLWRHHGGCLRDASFHYNPTKREWINVRL